MTRGSTHRPLNRNFLPSRENLPDCRRVYCAIRRSTEHVSLKHRGIVASQRESTHLNDGVSEDGKVESRDGYNLYGVASAYGDDGEDQLPKATTA